MKTIPRYTFNHGKKEKITVTCLDIRLHDLEPLIMEYRNEHNRTKHYFSENGKMSAWIPAQKFGEFLSKQAGTLTFSLNQIQAYMKYGFRKIKATVSKNKIIRHANRDYYVTSGADLFSRHKSTPVKISLYNDKLFIFEHGEDGILLGEALARLPFEKPPPPEPVSVEPDELSMIIDFLEQHNMIVDRPTLIEAYHKGMTLTQTKRIFNHNQARYMAYMKKMKQPEKRKGMALFNAFILDCQKFVNSNHAATYASHGDLT